MAITPAEQFTTEELFTTDEQFTTEEQGPPVGLITIQFTL